MADKQYEIRSDYDMPYRRSTQGLNTHFRGHMLADTYSSSPYSSKRDTPVPELETKAGPPRKRVPVACDRCRKRKIKCSGDQGNGSGCDNCKTVGWTECQFLRVRSSELLMPHPQIAPTRHYSYRPDHRYHPYGGGSRHHHYMAPTTHYSTQPQPSYPQWSPFEYAGLPGTATPVTWNGSGYVSTYSGYETPATHTYNTLPPSYMIPELDTHEGNAICMTSLGRPQQQPNNQLWLDNIQTASLPQQMSCIYPLTPAESTKSYCGIPGQHALSNERSLPLPGQSGIVSLPSSGQDTPPLSAASQRSSNPWDSSIGSTVSSRTSCGGSTDLSGNMENASIPVTCEEQAIIYPYVSESASPQIHTAAAVLPMSSEQIEDHTTPENGHMMMPDTTQMVIRDRPSREHRAMSGSSYNALYGYSRHGRRSSSRRARTMLSNLYTNCASPHGSLNYSPTSNSRHNISTQQSQSAGEADIYQLSEHRGSNVSLNSLANY